MIEIKDIQGNVILSVPVTKECQRVEELMVSDYIQLSWSSDSSEELPVGCFIEYNGEVFRLLEPYKPTQKNELDYAYTPQFNSKIMGWSKVPFFFYTTNEERQIKEPDWTLTSNPSDFMKCVCDALLNETGETWTYTIDASLPASVSLSFSSTDIFSGLNEIASAFETEWLADKSSNTIHLGKASYGNSATLEVGSNVKVPSVTKSKDGYYTRFYAFGSTRNIVQDYEGANVNNLVNKRLTLDPVKYPDGYKDIKEGLQDGEIFSKVLIFDDVYPSSKLSISSVRNRLMYRVGEDGKKIQIGTNGDGNPIYDQYAIWSFRLEDFDFDVSNIIEGYKLSVSFQSGALAGREFELKYYENDTDISTSDGIEFQAKAGDYEILFIEEGNYIIPSLTGLVPSDGDNVVLFNIKMPDEYTQSAYDELEAELDKEIERILSDSNNYSFNSNPVAFNEENPNLTIGRNVTYINGNYSLNTRVIKLTTQLDFPIEQSITIGNEKIKGNTQQLKEEVATANKDLNLLAVFNNMTQSLQQSYTRTQQMMLDGFAAIKDMWVLKTDKDGNRYAFSKFHVASQGGVTMYAQDGSINIPSVFDGLPIDNTTIYWEIDENGNRVLKAKGGEGGGGVTDSVAWGNVYGKPLWITDTKPSYSYSELSGTPDLSVYALKNDIPSLSGYATEQWVLGRGFALSSDLSKYIPIVGATDITGEKNFTGGLKVNGSPIYYDTEKKYWKLEGDLLVTGGVTMYGNDSDFVPSTIMDAIAVDGTTISKEGGILKVIGSVGGATTLGGLSNVDSMVDDMLPGLLFNQNGTWISAENTTIRSYLGIVNTIGGLTNVGAWADSVASQDRIMYQAANSSQWVAKNLSDLAVGGVTGNYLPLNMTSTPFVVNTQSGVVNFKSTSASEVGFRLYFGDSNKGGLWANDERIYLYHATTGNSVALSTNGRLIFKAGGVDYTVLHSNNYSSYALPLTGGLLSNSVSKILELNTTGTVEVGMRFSMSSVAKGWVGYIPSEGTILYNNTSLASFGVKDDGTLFYSGGTIWHSGNFTPSNYLPLTGGSITGDIGLSSLSIGSYDKSFASAGVIEKLNLMSDVSNYRTFLGSIYQNDSWNTIISVRHRNGVADGNLYGFYLLSPVMADKSNTDLYFRKQDYYGWGDSYKILHSGNISSYNAGSATKLQTARTIWGQSFDGTGNVTNDLYLPNHKFIYGTKTDGTTKLGLMSLNSSNLLVIGTDTAATGIDTYISGNNVRFRYGTSTIQGMILDSSGNVGIGTNNPIYKFEVVGETFLRGGLTLKRSSDNSNSFYIGQTSEASTTMFIQNGSGGGKIHIRTNSGGVFVDSVVVAGYTTTINNNLLTTGGVTMYSDIRKKTKLKDVVLSLQQIANAPLIEHYYNSDQNKTTHVGSIAQYWYGLNDWFCKEDNEGFLTMEIQNCALASAISIARELDRYESKTDKKIRQLKKRISQLEDELEKLKSM